MAGYVGSTAGSTSANPPVLLVAGMGGHVNYASTGSTTPAGNVPQFGSGAKVWFYSSTNLYTDVQAAGFFNDGTALGMSIGDVLIGVYSTAQSTAPFVYIGALVTSAGSTSFTMSTATLSSTAA